LSEKQSQESLRIRFCPDRSFTDKSDIDLIVDIDSNDPLDYADHYFNLKFALEELLNRQIDLLENKLSRTLISAKTLIIPKHFCMHPEIKVWLKDIQLSINEIHDFLPAPRNFFFFRRI